MEPSKCADIVSVDIWLGFCISKDGLTAEKQLERNYRKTPVLEYGSNWHQPDAKLAKKVVCFLEGR